MMYIKNPQKNIVCKPFSQYFVFYLFNFIYIYNETIKL
jgi:hypothetical protein